jgi:hypothetical protein
MFPSNDTNLSFAAVVKWLCIIFGGVFLFQAYQGIFQRQLGSRGGPLVSGDAAVRSGWMYVIYALVAFAASWTVWFFWQRNED